MSIIDYLRTEYSIKTDRELAKELDLSTPVISRIRNSKCGVSADVIIRIHEKFNIPIAEIKSLCSSDQ